jgi:hypothetical protein
LINFFPSIICVAFAQYHVWNSFKFDSRRRCKHAYLQVVLDNSQHSIATIFLKKEKNVANFNAIIDDFIRALEQQITSYQIHLIMGRLKGTRLDQTKL